MKLPIPVTAFVVAATCLSVIAAAAPPKTQPKTQPKAGATRTEHDLLGDKQVPANAYYGVQALRGMENFQLSGVAINHYPGFVEAWAIVKLAAARANTQVGAMKPERLAMIEKACKAIMDGKYHDQFLVDWYQGGAGTSTNMCANEVIANVGLEWADTRRASISSSSRTTTSTCRSRPTTRTPPRSRWRSSCATTSCAPSSNSSRLRTRRRVPSISPS
jgi:hypothetical protein